MSAKVEHPAHYGGADNAYEAIKVIEAWSLGFCLGNTVKYISRAGRKSGETTLDDLRKARWYLDREIRRIETTEITYGAHLRALRLRASLGVKVIAAAAGCSVGLVHDVESGRRPPFSEERTRAVIRELGFTPEASRLLDLAAVDGRRVRAPRGSR